MPMAYSKPSWLKPSPGLRVFLLVFLLIASVIWGLFTLWFILAILQGVTQSGTVKTADDWTGVLVLGGIWVVLFGISLVATIGVFIHASWARWAAIAAGIATCLTCLGMILGIPILVAAARAPGLGKQPLTP
jgi:hypothetical protein